jgi:hypothetical protein
MGNSILGQTAPLLVAEIADVKQSVFELPSELRAAAVLQPRDQVSKHGLERYNKPSAPRRLVRGGEPSISPARGGNGFEFSPAGSVSARPLNDPSFSSAFFNGLR